MLADSLNRGQRKIYDEAMVWWIRGNNNTFEISGPPGSGKSFLINAIVDGLGINKDRVAPMSYTGTASINMRMKGLYNATTCHSRLYDFIEVPVLDENGKEIIDPIFNKPKKHKKLIERDSLLNVDLIIVDECGSIPPDIRRVIDKHNIPVIACGDLDQLPPIEGKSAYLNNPSNVHILDEIMRQNMNSAIVYLSQRAIKGEPIHNGYYGDVLVIYEDELNDLMIKNSQIILCGKNKTREALNDHIRHDILGYNSSLPIYG